MSGVRVRPLAEADLAEADRINRIAFGTFFGLADPATFRGDGDVVHGRFHANPEGAFAAEKDGRLVGCGFVMDWGSVGILGPLTVEPDCWGRGVARAVMPEMIAYMDRRGFAVQGLFTHPQSAKHIRLYETYGFWMQRITAVMEKTVDPAASATGAEAFSALDDAGRAAALDGSLAVTEAIFPGLDLRREIRAIRRDGTGETLFLRRGGKVTGFACCHHGPMSEAGSAQMLVKFAAVMPGEQADADFGRLLAACEGAAAARGVRRLVAGTNTGRAECYRALLDAGFRTWMNGIAMLRPDGPGYNVPGVHVIDDWR